MQLSSIYDLSDELIIQRRGTGICLAKPDNRNKHLRDQFSLGSIMQLPVNTCFLAPDSIIQRLNETAASNCGFISARDAQLRTVASVSLDNSADLIMANDRHVIRTQTLYVKDERLLKKDGSELVAVSFKFPWFHQQQIAGIFDMSIVVSSTDVKSFASSMNYLVQLGLINPTFHRTPPGTTADDIYFDTRELNIMQLLNKKFTAKQIAKQLGMSNRTVEYHIARIRLKTRTSNKIELLEWIAAHEVY
jgi:DNA-binding CsgD family transcriptional regulator